MGTHILFAILAGTVMGFLGSMPIAGPVAVLVLERGLVRRGREGLGVAMGAAAAESVYAFFAFWGLGTVLYGSPALLRASRLVGAGVMITLGLYLANRKSAPRVPQTEGDAPVAGRKRRGFLLGLSVTFLNPTIIVSWTMVTATVHSTGLVAPGLISAIVFAAGVGAGIVLWFATLLQLLHRFQSGLRPQTVDRVLNITGWLVVAIGVGLGVRPFAQAFGWVRP
jgi:threonine/homoserine/homoserine lactone efflux protein